MNLGTHAAFASVLYLSGAALLGYAPEPVGWTLTVIAALIPDVDLPTSHIGRLCWFLSVPLERRFGHRTLTHSALALAGVAGLASPLLLMQSAWFWAVVGGYWSHLWLDMVNIRGIDLFWPSPIRVVMPGNRHWRIEVGSKAEMILLFLLLAFVVALYPLGAMGIKNGLQQIIANFDIAREQYRHQAGKHWYTLDLEATDNLTLQPVKGRFPIIGVWQNGLIVEQAGQLKAVGASATNHTLYPLRARLVTGEPLQVVAERVAMSGRTLRGLLSRIDQSRPYYLLGEVEIADGKGAAISSALNSVESYNPALYRGGILQLHYARAQELGPWLDRVAIRGEIVVQFWLKPGEAAVMLGPGAEREVERIPVQLQRFL